MAEQRLTFTFHTCLGKGGFGEVYLATLTRPGGLEKRVAVKVLKEDLRNVPEAVKRLRDEGRMLAILDHPCIVRVIEMTLIRGRVALVTEYLDGVDLARCCRPPRLLPPKVIVGALGEVASALHCAWTTLSPETGKPLELIHRDVKPENIRIGRHGEVKLLDFGIARTTEMFRHAKTAMGDLPFTPGYAAPEAFTKGFQGSASDVYALGVTMYRLLVGERLYEEMELADQVTTCCLAERYTPFLRQRLAKVNAPAPVVELLSDMLAYDAPARPSAAEVERRCVAVGDALEGPTHVRWARGTELPDPIALPDGSLTGETIEEDRIQEGSRPTKRRGVQLQPKAGRGRLLDLPDLARPLAALSASVIADLTPPPEPPRLPPAAPPRVPAAPPRTPPPPTPVPGLSRAVTPEVTRAPGGLLPDATVPPNRLAAPSPPLPPPPPTDLIGVRPVTGPMRSAAAAQGDVLPARKPEATLDMWLRDLDARNSLGSVSSISEVLAPPPFTPGARVPAPSAPIPPAPTPAPPPFRRADGTAEVARAPAGVISLAPAAPNAPVAPVHAFAAASPTEGIEIPAPALDLGPRAPLPPRDPGSWVGVLIAGAVGIGVLTVAFAAAVGIVLILVFVLL